MFDINTAIQILRQAYELLPVFELGIIIQSILVMFLIFGLLLALSRKNGANPSIFQRTLLGLVLLAAVNIGLLVLFIFQYIYPINYPDLQFIYIGSTLLNIVVLVWLWAFPYPTRALDIVAALTGALVVVLSALALFWLPGSDFSNILDSLNLGVVSGLIGVGFLLVGILYLLFNRPPLWGFGLFSQILLILCFVFQIIVLPNRFEFPTAVYLAFWILFPLLLALPLRFTKGMVSDELDFDKKEKEDLLRHLEKQQAVLDRRPSYTDPKILQAIVEIMSEEELNDVCTKIAVTIGRIMRADICAIINLQDEEGRIVISCGYDSKKEAFLQNVEFEKEQLPQIQTANQDGEVINTTSLEANQDISHIARGLSLEKPGPALYIPVNGSKNKPGAGVLLMSPYTGREWTDGDEYYISILARLLVYFLHQRREINNLDIQLSETRKLELEARDLYREAKLQHQLFLDQVSNFQEEEITERSRFKQLIDSQSDSTDIQTLSLSASIKEQSEDIVKHWKPEFDISESERLQSELNLALEEIALLRSEIDQINREDI